MEAVGVGPAPVLQTRKLLTLSKDKKDKTHSEISDTVGRKLRSAEVGCRACW